MDLTFTEVAPEETQQEADQELKEAKEEQRRLGPSDVMMARYGVRVLPPRDHRRGWDYPYSRPGGLSSKGAGKSSSKGGDKSSSSSSG